ncbi:TonB-dependent receptor [Phenylobacterium sp.]|uniref:TonB-dependent receptor n=1 Tax=Phenylobacterium sp. TaxID=1871053 RepID=UPI00301BF8AE
MNKTRLLGTVTMAAILSATVSGEVMAQAAASDLEELVVTARRREEALRDVPAAVSAVTADALRQRGGVKDVADLSYMLPGVGLANARTINAENNIRGAGAGTTRTNNADSPVAVLRDGASITGGNLGGRVYTRADLFDLQRVEVIRGPQGSLYGVNAVGGVMQAISVRPRAEPGFLVRTTYSPKIERTAIDVIGNLPLSDTFALRVGGQVVDKGKGFFYNRFTQDYGDREKYEGFRVSAQWAPTEALSVFSAYDRSDERSTSNFVNTTNQVNDRTLPPAQAFPADTDGPFLYANNASNDVNRDLNNWLTEIRYDTGKGRITSTSLYRLRDTNWSQDADRSAPGFGPAFPASCGTLSCVLIFYDRTEIYSEDLRYETSLSERVDIQVGANVVRKESRSFVLSDGRTVSAANLAPSPTLNNNTVSIEKEKTWGVFAAVNARVTEAFTVDVGLRYGESDKDFDNYVVRRMSGAVACPYQTPFQAPALGPACTEGRALIEDTFKSFTPSLALRYAVGPTFRVFASVARGQRAGGFNGNSVFDLGIPPTFGQETATAYEAGAKWEVGRVAFAASGFYNRYGKLLVGLVDFGPDLVSRAYRNNAGSAESYGVDFEASGSQSWSDGSLLSGTLAVNWIQGEVTSGPYKGLTIENIPEWMVTGQLYWERPVAGDWRAFAALSYRAERGGFTGFINFNNQVKASNISLARGAIGATNDTWRLELSAENLFDRTYEAIRDTNRSVWGDKREVRLTAAYAWGSERR